MSKEQQELLDEVYENYESRQINMYIPIWSQEEFINKCKTNPEFSENWGLKIEERELSLEERKIHMSKYSNDRIYPDWDEKFLNEKGIPNKIIKIAYNNKTIESYE
jgi:hypothetical protein